MLNIRKGHQHFICDVSIPFSSKKKVSLVNHLVNPVGHVLMHNWRTSDAPYRKNVRIFTSENSNENLSKSHGISLVPHTHFSYGLSRAGDTSQVKSLVKIRFFHEFSLMKSLASDTSQVKSLVKFRIFPMSFYL